MLGINKIPDDIKAGTDVETVINSPRFKETVVSAYKAFIGSGAFRQMSSEFCEVSGLHQVFFFSTMYLIGKAPKDGINPLITNTKQKNSLELLRKMNALAEEALDEEMAKESVKIN
jgi:hypothetical protein